MDILQNFAEWAWARHQNPWSWYVRPLFLVPFAYFAWRRSMAGVMATVLGLATSMFWFPAPSMPDARSVEFLEAERQYLRGPWSATTFLSAASVPAFFIAVAMAFWRRAIWIGLALINAASLLKIGWSFYYGGSSAWAILPPATLGLVAINAFVVFALWRSK